MAKVVLDFYDRATVTNLPPVCMQCGAPATMRHAKCFRWTPQWVGYVAIALLFTVTLLAIPVSMVLALALRKYQWVEVPLCDRHRNPWRWQQLATWGGAGVFLAIFLITSGAFVGDFAMNATGGVAPLGIGLLAATALTFVLWLASAGIVAQRAIHAARITARDIKLVNVSRDFAEAVDEELGGYGRERDADFTRLSRPKYRDGPDDGYRR